MNKSSRKPICPACNGAGGWNSTYLDPAEMCLLCNERGRVSKRIAERYHTRRNQRRVLAHAIKKDVDYIDF